MLAMPARPLLRTLLTAVAVDDSPPGAPFMRVFAHEWESANLFAYSQTPEGTLNYT